MRTTSGKDWIRESTRQAIYHRDNDRCFACGGAHSLSLDHVKPNGDNRPANLITLCLRCNRDKTDRALKDWRPDLVAAVRAQCRKPIDREEGMRRFRIVRPARYAQEQFRASPEGRALAARRKAERASAIEKICDWTCGVSTSDMGYDDPRVDVCHLMAGHTGPHVFDWLPDYRPALAIVYANAAPASC